MSRLRSGEPVVSSGEIVTGYIGVVRIDAGEYRRRSRPGTYAGNTSPGSGTAQRFTATSRRPSSSSVMSMYQNPAPRTDRSRRLGSLPPRTSRPRYGDRLRRNSRRGGRLSRRVGVFRVRARSTEWSDQLDLHPRGPRVRESGERAPTAGDGRNAESEPVAQCRHQADEPFQEPGREDPRRQVDRPPDVRERDPHRVVGRLSPKGERTPRR